MKITVFGSGYVGLVTGSCFAEMGNHVTCVDIDAKRVENLSRGKCPIFEPGLEDMLKQHLAGKRLVFTTDAKAALKSAEVIFIAVGTPQGHDGSADLQYVLKVAETIGSHINGYVVVVNKSTVPVGTADLVRETIARQLQKRKIKTTYDVVSNPEFLKEGSAISDCMKPDRIVVGSNSERATQLLKNLYASFNRNHDRLLVMDVRSAELTKYAANAMLATKISFINEISRIADKVGADIEQVRKGIGSDSRIGYSFIYPGCGYGGSCFPKDVQALHRTAKEYGYTPEILFAVHEVNEQQKLALVDKVQRYYGNKLKGKTFALWGLSFKPNTDDIREAPSRVIMENLWAHGAKIQAFDPEAMDAVKKAYGKQAGLKLCDSPEATLENADALIIVTEWSMFRSPDFTLLKQKLKDKVIFDGRNLYDPAYMKSVGLHYYAIGRPAV